MFKQTKTYLHIGYPKTGTTWFQEELFPKIENIEFYSYCGVIKKFDKKLNKVTYDEIGSILSNLKNPLVISDESMLGSSDKIRENAFVYQNLFKTPIIIIFIRNQIDKYVSNYSHYIKIGGTLKFNEFLFPYNSSIPFGGLKHKYHLTLNIYKEIFGEKNVHIYLYEDFRINPRLFIEKFCNRYNFRTNIIRLNYSKKNKKLSKMFLSLKRYSNYLTKEQPPWMHLIEAKKRYLIHIPYWHFFSLVFFEKLNSINFFGNELNNKDFIGERNSKILHDYFSESNQQLIKIHELKRIKDYNYPL